MSALDPLALVAQALINKPVDKGTDYSRYAIQWLRPASDDKFKIGDFIDQDAFEQRHADLTAELDAANKASLEAGKQFTSYIQSLGAGEAFDSDSQRSYANSLASAVVINHLQAIELRFQLIELEGQAARDLANGLLGKLNS